MIKNVFTIEEAENMFEIGRIVQAMVDNEEIEIEDSKSAFAVAVKLSMEFEKNYPETEDYYADFEEFVTDKILEEFGVED